MRSIVISIIVMIVLSAGFFVYTRMQPPVVQVQNSTTISTDPAAKPGEGETSFSSGKRPWVQEFSETTGSLRYQFRGDRFDRQADGSDKVLNPEAEFFLGEEKTPGEGRRMVRIVGKTGDIVSAQVRRPKRDFASGDIRVPTRGLLHDVTIYMFDNEHDKSPELTAVMNNAAFDNDTFRIYTEAFVAPDGTHVAADQVPVTVRGTDFDFDGKGLIIRMDELDKQLRSLEIAHGQRLVVKKTSAFATPVLGPSGMTEMPDMFAAADDSAIKQSAGAPPAHRRRPPKPASAAVATPRTGVYRASFFDNVHVTQGADSTIDAARMEVDFLMKNSEEENPANSTTAPVLNSANQAVAPEKTGAKPPLDSARGSQATTQTKRAKDGATTSASTKPSQPVEVTWSGKLVIIPVDEQLEKDESIARFFGSPVVVHQKDNLVHCAELDYNNKQQVVLMKQNDSGAPVQLKDGRGALVTTNSMRYSVLDRLATLSGAGNVTMPVKDEKTQKTQNLTARWSRECEMEMQGGKDQQPMVIQRVAMRGDVDIHHPQLVMNADTLDLGFEPSKATKKADGSDMTGNAALKRVDASGDVHCVITDADTNKRAIDCEKLHLIADEGPNGEMIARRLDAAGKVHAVDTERDLVADIMTIELQQQAEKTELQRLLARGHVIAKSSNESSARGDELYIEMQKNEPYVRVIGPNAMLTNKDSTLSGTYIEFWRGEQRGDVKGAGHMTGTQRGDNGKGAPMDVTWTDGITMDGAHDRIDVNGNVHVTTKANDGAVDTADSRRLVILLAPAPASATKPATKPASQGQTDFLAGKEMRQIQLLDQVKVQSLLGDATGNVARQVDLFAEEVDYDRVQSKTTVPLPGKLFFADLRTTPTQNTQTESPANGKGKTAMQWDKSLVYDEGNHQATVLGNVKIVHDSPNSTERYNLLADKVVADLAADKQQGAPSDQAQVNKVHAEGNVLFTGRNAEITATAVDYDPQNQLLVATGTDRLPVEVTDEKGDTSQFEQVSYDARTGEIKSLKDFRGSIRTKEKPKATQPTRTEKDTNGHLPKIKR